VCNCGIYIRVHLSHLGYPIIGDEVYGNSHPLMKRQALHSNKLSFVHPITKENLSFTKEPPEDYMELKNAIWNN
jgi:23S rRNA pseudouridine1911/1915/1917 synthase